MLLKNKGKVKFLFFMIILMLKIVDKNIVSYKRVSEKGGSIFELSH